jgi:phospholipase C
VPLIVVSPYAKRGYVSHVTHDFGSVLHFIEATFQLPTLGYADAVADDLSDCFDFSQKPPRFLSFTSRFDAAHFMNETRPALDPDDD